jgi:hypothetical protein
MRSSKSWFAAVLLAIAGFCIALPQPAYADTYSIVPLGSDQGYLFSGMDDAGTVVINSSGFCFTNCYDVYVNGVLTALNTPTPPNIIDDQGTPCTPSVPSGGTVIHGVCNNGREAFTGWLTTSQVHPDVYTGPNDGLLAIDGGGLIYMNSVGDIVFDNQFKDQWFEAFDLTPDPVPEPNPALLVATGLLGLAAATRRRLLTSRL